MSIKNTLRTMAVGLVAMAGSQATSAAMLITEVSPTGSSNSTYKFDWFELTNTGSSAVDITGWKMDDNSNSSALAVGLRGVTSIGAGQSVVFLEGDASGSNDAANQAAFKAAWFGSNVPSSLVIGGYGGNGVGLSAGGDAVNLYNSTNTLMASVSFGSATQNVSFDNSAGLNNTTISQLSVVGANGAFNSVTGSEVGSPGVAPVPLPAAAWLLLSGLGLMVGTARRKLT